MSCFNSLSKPNCHIRIYQCITFYDFLTCFIQKNAGKKLAVILAIRIAMIYINPKVYASRAVWKQKRIGEEIYLGNIKTGNECRVSWTLWQYAFELSPMIL